MLSSSSSSNQLKSISHSEIFQPNTDQHWLIGKLPLLYCHVRPLLKKKSVTYNSLLVKSCSEAQQFQLLVMSAERLVREGESSGTPPTVLGQRVPDTRGTPASIVCHRTPEDPGGAQATILVPRTQESGGGGGTQGTILEDDQQLYDWGIENRLDQYTYQVNSNICAKRMKNW